MAVRSFYCLHHLRFALRQTEVFRTRSPDKSQSNLCVVVASVCHRLVVDICYAVS